MNVDEAFYEMKRRRWGFARNVATGRIGIGPMEGGIINVLAFDTDPVKCLEEAIKVYEQKTA